MDLRILLACVPLCAAPTLALAGPGDDDPSSAALAGAAQKTAPSLVRVEYTGQYDKGESPGADRWASWRAYNAGGSPESYESWDQLLKEERPSERGGYLVAPNQVYTSDPMLHPRFLKSIKVRFNDQVVDAKPAAYAKDESGWFLTLAEPLKGATPLAFDAAKPGPYFTVAYERREGVWTTRVAGLRTGVALTEDQRRIAPNAPCTLVIDKEGNAVAMTGDGNLPVDDSWKGPPSKWAVVSADEMTSLLSRLESESGKGIVRVQLVLRSPRSADGMGGRFSRYRPAGDDEQVVTEWNGTGVLVDGSTLMVLANLKPKITGRLERVRVFLPDGTEAAATFSGTLKDWGCFLAKLDRPLTGAVKLATGSILDARDRLLLKAEIGVRGETRTAYLSRDRISSFFTSYKGAIYPSVSASREGRYDYYGSGPAAVNFLFGLDGAMVAMPIERREKVSTEERYGYNAGNQTVMAPASIIADVLRTAKGDAGSAGGFDPENKPLSEAEENRLAWLGVELQGMDPELARASNVMDQTEGGRSGGVVTYIYQNSPASQAGLKMGDILLRLHVDGQPKPLEVVVADHGMGEMGDQFWQYLDQMPEEYLDQLPQPWGAAETPLTRALTDLGFGTPFKADVFRDGKVMSVDFKVAQGPAHYNSAAKFKSEDLGLTVRDLTYEVRRHFQIQPDEAGVIISKVERGTKAAVSGLKPYETIRSINDKPITTVKDFEAATKQGGEFKIAVKRMTKGRTVKIKLDAAEPGEAKKPVNDDAAAVPAGAGG